MEPSCGNPEVIGLLETYLRTAKERNFGSVAVVMTAYPNIAAVDFAGDVALEQATLDALGLASKKVEASIANWTLPPRDELLDASYHCYNLANSPLGFDFLTWLVEAEMTRVREGAPAPLKIGFYFGTDGRAERVAYRRAFLDNIFRPLLSLIGAVEDSAAIRGRHKHYFVGRDIVAAARAGERVPLLAAPPLAGKYLDLLWTGYRLSLQPPVTITLRESGHWPHRNSNVDAWFRFALYLKEKGERVVFIRDTQRAVEPLPMFPVIGPAATDVRIRMALYERARANLFVSNGPATLALFSERPFLQFIRVEPPDSAANFNTAKFWAESMGVPVGEQYPWSAPDQRLVFKPDDYDNIVQAWEEFISAPRR